MMSKVKLLLLIAFFAQSATSSEIQEFIPTTLMRFPQGVFWDSRTETAVFVDTSAVDNNSSIYQFDWKSKRLYATTLTKSSTVPSFCIPTVSDSELLLCGFPDCISYVSLPHLSDKAIRRKDVACKSSDLSQIDRGATLSDGTLLVSFIPGKYCDEDPGHPKAAAAYFDLKTHSFVDAVFPGFYSNGFAYDPKRKTLFMGDDCMPGVVAYQYDDLKKSFTFLRIVYRFLPGRNFPSGFALDKCGNLYVGEHNAGKIYYINTKTGELLKTIDVPGTRVADVAIVGPKLDHLAVLTGVRYHDTFGNNRYTDCEPDGNGKLLLIPLANDCCRGRAGTPVTDCE